ncbi:MAG: DUF6569 family protein [Planctomycetota bacterium]
MRPVRLRPALLITLFVLVAAVPGLAAKGKPIAADHPFVKFLARTAVQRGREHRALLVYPIAREEADPKDVTRFATATEAHQKKRLSVGEPEKKPGRGPIDLFNWSTEPILILSGEVFTGGHRDRFLSRDVLIAPGSRVKAPAYVADKKPRKKDEAEKSLKPVNVLAPDLLRLIALIEGPAARAREVLSDQFVMAGDNNPRQPLSELYRAKLLGPRSLEYRTVYGAIPDEAAKKTIGFAALVGDRLVGIELFGTNAEFRAHWPKILDTLAFEAALYEAAYGLLGQPFPPGRDPDRHLVPMKERMKKLYAATVTPEKAIGLGTELLLSRDDLVGRLLLHEKKLVHATVLLDSVTATAPDLPPPPPPAGGEVSPGELERRAERSRLTEYERRLLERMRKRRAAKPPVKPE